MLYHFRLSCMLFACHQYAAIAFDLAFYYYKMKEDMKSLGQLTRLDSCARYGNSVVFLSDGDSLQR